MWSTEQAKGDLFDLATLLKERVYAIAAGYEDCNDLDTLKDDPGLRVACGKDIHVQMGELDNIGPSDLGFMNNPG